MKKKYWLVFVLVYLLMVHIVGGAIYTDYAYAFGYLLVSAVIGGVVLYRAKSPLGITAGHLTQIVLGVSLIFTAYGDVKERNYEIFFDACRYNNQNVKAAIVSGEDKDKYCTCMADLTIDNVMWHGTSSALLFKEVEPIEQNRPFQKDIYAAAMVCEQGL